MPTTALPAQLCSRPFGKEELHIIRDIIRTGCKETIHRTEIARRVCDALEWRNQRGELKQMGARVALLRLHRQGWISLPEPLTRNGNGADQIARLEQVPVPAPSDSELICGLSELGEIHLQKVQSKADSLLWDAMINRYHYLGHTPLSGAQIRYLISADQGLIGGIGFGAAAYSLKARDQWIGWDQAQREQGRELVLNNRRFLILPWIRVANLASHILAKAVRQVRVDFQDHYGYVPLLLETFVEQDRFTGGCYRAANWVKVGLTTGRGRNDRSTYKQRKYHGAPLAIKQVWLYPLCRHVRERLCVPPASSTSMEVLA